MATPSGNATVSAVQQPAEGTTTVTVNATIDHEIAQSFQQALQSLGKEYGDAELTNVQVADGQASTVAIRFIIHGTTEEQLAAFTALSEQNPVLWDQIAADLLKTKMTPEQFVAMYNQTVLHSMGTKLIYDKGDDTANQSAFG